MKKKEAVLITGAGSGIGRAIAQCLSKNNYSIILLGRVMDNLLETKKSLDSPGDHQCISCDIRLSEDIAKALKNIKINSPLIKNNKPETIEKISMLLLVCFFIINSRNFRNKREKTICKFADEI